MFLTQYIQDNLSESLPTQKWEGLEAVRAHSDGAISQVGRRSWQISNMCFKGVTVKEEKL